MQSSLGSQIAAAEDFREKKVTAGNTRIANPLRREDVSRVLPDFVNEKLTKGKRTFGFERRHHIKREDEEAGFF